MGVLRRAGEAAVVIEGIVASASFNQASSSVKLFRASTSPLPRFTVTFTLGGLGGSGCFQTLKALVTRNVRTLKAGPLRALGQQLSG